MYRWCVAQESGVGTARVGIVRLFATPSLRVYHGSLRLDNKEFLSKPRRHGLNGCSIEVVIDALNAYAPGRVVGGRTSYHIGIEALPPLSEIRRHTWTAPGDDLGGSDSCSPVRGGLLGSAR